MRALKILVVVMGVMIVAGVVVMIAVIAQRLGGGGTGASVSDTVLAEPAGTHIAGSSLGGDRLAIRLQGGGPDRVVVLDVRNGRVVARAGLAQ